MDTELARTFLTVANTGSFVAAAERLHLTQSTVSARIRTLEELLGRRLFIRNKSGASLTDAGRRFQKHAGLLVRTVEQARHDVGLPQGIQASITIGARIGLWDGLLLDWLAEMRRRLPEVSIRAEIGFEPDLMQGLIDGRVDLGVMYTPQRRPNLELIPFIEERLVLVEAPADAGRTEAPRSAGDRTDYVHVDWGPEFYAWHSAAFPDHVGPRLSVNIGWLGLRHLLDCGGSGYFPLRLVERLIAQGRLRRVEAADFALPSWIVHPRDLDQRRFGPMIETLAALARSSGDARPA